MVSNLPLDYVEVNQRFGLVPLFHRHALLLIRLKNEALKLKLSSALLALLETGQIFVNGLDLIVVLEIVEVDNKLI